MEELSALERHQAAGVAGEWGCWTVVGGGVPEIGGCQVTFSLIVHVYELGFYSECGRMPFMSRQGIWLCVFWFSLFWAVLVFELMASSL
jgi:hypothetical protein